MKNLHSTIDAATYLYVSDDKAIPLLFLADKYHLMKYSRKITSICYSFNEGISSSNLIVFLNPKSKFDHLSISDKEALDFAKENFNKYSLSELNDYFSSFIPEGNIGDDIYFSYPEKEKDPFSIIDKRIVELSRELKLERDELFTCFEAQLKN